MVWTMLVLVVGGSVAGFPTASESACRANLARLAAGESMIVTYDNKTTGQGFKIQVIKGIDCVQLSLDVDEGAVL